MQPQASKTGPCPSFYFSLYFFLYLYTSSALLKTFAKTHLVLRVKDLGMKVLGYSEINLGQVLQNSATILC